MTALVVPFTVGAGLRRAEIPALCDRLAGLLPQQGGGLVRCDVAAAHANLVTVEALSRLRLTARRHGCRLKLTGAGPALCDLLALLGLAPLFAAGQ